MPQTPASGYVATTYAGWVVYWVTFGLMAGSAVCFFAFTLTKPQRHRKHGYCTTLIVCIAAAAYYAMASEGGNTYIYQIRGNDQRQIYWARYVDWVFTTPLLLLDLLLMSACPVGTALWIIAADIFMIVLGLCGAVNTHKFKWGYYAMACFCEVAINIGLMFNARRCAVARGGSVCKVYVGMAAYLSVLWWGYPIVWGLAEGSNTISSDAEVASYAGLDIAAKVFFGWAVMAMYPVISTQQDNEAQEGKGVPSMLEASIDAPLSITQGLNTKTNAQTTHALPHVEPADRSRELAVTPVDANSAV